MAVVKQCNKCGEIITDISIRFCRKCFNSLPVEEAPPIVEFQTMENDVSADRVNDVSTDKVNDVSTDRVNDVSADRVNDVSTDKVNDVSTDRVNDVLTDRVNDVSAERVNDVSTDRVNDVSTDRVNNVLTDRGNYNFLDNFVDTPVETPGKTPNKTHYQTPIGFNNRVVERSEEYHSARKKKEFNKKLPLILIGIGIIIAFFTLRQSIVQLNHIDETAFVEGSASIEVNLLETVEESLSAKIEVSPENIYELVEIIESHLNEIDRSSAEGITEWINSIYVVGDIKLDTIIMAKTSEREMLEVHNLYFDGVFLGFEYDKEKFMEWDKFVFAMTEVSADTVTLYIDFIYDIQPEDVATSEYNILDTLENGIWYENRSEEVYFAEHILSQLDALDRNSLEDIMMWINQADFDEEDIEVIMYWAAVNAEGEPLRRHDERNNDLFRRNRYYGEGFVEWKFNLFVPDESGLIILPIFFVYDYDL
jgi:hypothetical protein